MVFVREGASPTFLRPPFFATHHLAGQSRCRKTGTCPEHWQPGLKASPSSQTAMFRIIAGGFDQQLHEGPGRDSFPRSILSQARVAHETLPKADRPPVFASLISRVWLRYVEQPEAPSASGH
jgi:hypothetical protein